MLIFAKDDYFRVTWKGNMRFISDNPTNSTEAILIKNNKRVNDDFLKTEFYLVADITKEDFGDGGILIEANFIEEISEELYFTSKKELEITSKSGVKCLVFN